MFCKFYMFLIRRNDRLWDKAVIRCETVGERSLWVGLRIRAYEGLIDLFYPIHRKLHKTGYFYK